MAARGQLGYVLLVDGYRVLARKLGRTYRAQGHLNDLGPPRGLHHCVESSYVPCLWGFLHEYVEPLCPTTRTCHILGAFGPNLQAVRLAGAYINFCHHTVSGHGPPTFCSALSLMHSDTLSTRPSDQRVLITLGIAI